MEVSLLQVLHADLAASDSCTELPSFECFRGGSLHELPPRLHGGQPEAELVGEVVAGAAGTIALDERRGAEILETGAGRDQGLTAPFRTSCRVL